MPPEELDDELEELELLEDELEELLDELELLLDDELEPTPQLAVVLTQTPAY